MDETVADLIRRYAERIVSTGKEYGIPAGNGMDGLPGTAAAALMGYGNIGDMDRHYGVPGSISVPPGYHSGSTTIYVPSQPMAVEAMEENKLRTAKDHYEGYLPPSDPNSFRNIADVIRSIFLSRMTGV